MSREKIALLVATRDRRLEDHAVLEGLDAQTRRPDRVIVVDGGQGFRGRCGHGISWVQPDLPEDGKAFRRQTRNMGLSAVDDDIAYVGFLDDDIVLDRRAIEEMMSFWHGASDRIGARP